MRGMSWRKSISKKLRGTEEKQIKSNNYERRKMRLTTAQLKLAKSEEDTVPLYLMAVRKSK